MTDDAFAVQLAPFHEASAVADLILVDVDALDPDAFARLVVALEELKLHNHQMKNLNHGLRVDAVQAMQEESAETNQIQIQIEAIRRTGDHTHASGRGVDEAQRSA